MCTLYYLHDPGVEEVQELLDNLLPDVGHHNGGLAAVAIGGVHLEHVAEERRDGGQYDLVGQQLPVIAEDRHVSEQPVLLAQLGDGDNVAVVTLGINQYYHSMTNKRPVFRSRDPHQPMGRQYLPGRSPRGPRRPWSALSVT